MPSCRSARGELKALESVEPLLLALTGDLGGVVARLTMSNATVWRGARDRAARRHTQCNGARRHMNPAGAAAKSSSEARD